METIRWLEKEIGRSKFSEMINVEINNKDWKVFSEWYGRKYKHLEKTTNDTPFWAGSSEALKIVFDDWKKK